MDGTLLNAKSEIAPQTQQAIMQLQDRGIEFVVATGRTLKNAYAPFKDLNIHPNFITLNGAQVFDEDLQLKLTLPLNHINVETTIEQLEKFDLYFDLTTQNAIYSNNQVNRREILTHSLRTKQPNLTSSEIKNLVENRELNLGFKYVDSYKPILKDPNEHVLKFVVFSQDKDKLAHLAKELKDNPALSVTASEPYDLEINAVEAKKGNALADFAQSRNIAPNEVVVFGDNLNDISMFEFAGTGIAMENTAPELLNIADHVTGSNIEDGVANGIQTFIFNK